MSNNHQSDLQYEQIGDLLSVKEDKFVNEIKSIDNDMIINLLNIYLQEYIHRDNHMWSQTYKFFFASLVIMLLPNLTERLGINIPEIFSSHKWIFPLAGIALAIIFLYVSLGLAKRFQASSETYNKLINLLPKEVQRVKLAELPIKLLNKTHNYILITLMFLVLIIIGILMLV